MDLEFVDLSYSVKSYFNIAGAPVTILNEINGQFRAGELCAILGPSGAGKTTLLHALSGYRTKGISGKVLVNGKERDEHDFRRRSCYITQENRLPRFTTVGEAMRMAAELKLPQTMEQRDKEKTVLEILTYLGLNEHDTKTEHLSGGQQKRLSIALELINNPPVFFLDEPTSGLDTVTTKLCVQLLRELAREGRTIVCTIHQPPASLLAMFDRIYIVAKGVCVYQGQPRDLVTFLQSAGYLCPTFNNPADFIIELVDSDPENVAILSKAINNGKETFYQQIEIEKENQTEQINNNNNNDDDDENSRLVIDYQWLKLKQTPLDKKVSFPTSSWYQFSILLNRYLMQAFRNKKALTIQAIHYITCGLLLGAVYYDNANDGSMMYNHLKFCVGVIIFFSHTRLFIPIILYPSDVKIAKMEHFNRWYGLMPFYMASTIAALPVHLFYNMVYISIVYYLSGLPRELWRFIMYALIGNAVSLSTEGVGFAVGSTFNAVNGSVIGPSVTVPFLCLAIYGFDFAKHISILMKFIMHTSPMRCGLAAFVIVTFGFGRAPLNCDQIYCHFADPRVLMEYLDGYEDQIFLELTALLLIIVFYRILAYIGLKIRFAT